MAILQKSSKKFCFTYLFIQKSVCTFALGKFTECDTDRQVTYNQTSHIMRLAELLKKVGEPYCERHLDEFGLESADYVADFYNNGGLELHDYGVHLAIQYASVEDGRVEIGGWAWADDEDFDTDAEFIVREEDDFTEPEIQRIYDAVKAIYGNK